MADTSAVTQEEPTPAEAQSLRDLTPTQWKSGIAAWLGWLFDGLDMHLYTLVALPFVAQLMATQTTNPAVGRNASIIQAAFLFGWAIGGGLFGRIGDRLGRSRALMLTILTYAIFTGLSYFAQEWWHLMIFRFLAALGIGGEWAVGSSLLAETWPARWRPWLAGVLQSAVNIGIMLAMVAGLLLADFEPKYIFLVGILPAFVTLWIRRAVPEPKQWTEARRQSGDCVPGISSLFAPSLRRTTVMTLLVCATSLTAHWAFMFWATQHLRVLPEAETWTVGEKTGVVSKAMMVLMVGSILGNFLAAGVARLIGYRRAIVTLCLAYFAVMCFTYASPRSYNTIFLLFFPIGVCQGVFALFTMYLPPLFPTLLRTTGAGFCYNIGRIAAATGTIFFGLFTKIGDYRLALLFASFLFIPAAGVAVLLPDDRREKPAELA